MGTARRGLLVGFVLGAALVVLVVGSWLALTSGALPIVQVPFVPRPSLSAQEREGGTLYVANCQTCHGGPSGGSMMDYPPRHNANGHTWHHPDCELLQIVRDGGDEMTQAMREMMAPPDAPQMPVWRDKLSDDQISAVLAYIKTMWTPQERDAQAEITQQSCGAV